jgi:hypothetical protein
LKKYGNLAKYAIVAWGITILEWTTTTLGNDDSLEKFFEAIPGFLNSDLVRARETDSLKKLGRYLSDTLILFHAIRPATWTTSSALYLPACLPHQPMPVTPLPDKSSK